MKKKPTLVVKLGTSVLTGGSKQLDRARMVELVRQCAKLQHEGWQIIVVTSGAIAAGREYLGFPELASVISSKQVLAAVGQSKLIQVWEQLFSLYSIHTGQMLLTRADLEDRERFLNARDLLLALLEQGIVPVVNENDAVATDEIKVGDNDNLSALVAILARADTLLLLTDIDGLFTANPAMNPNATLIKEVPTITEDIYRMAGGTHSGLGTGGMTTKIQAASVACSAGIEVIIANGAKEGIIESIASNSIDGTRFFAYKNPLEERKRWIFGAPVAGEVHIDDGAVKALTTRGSSLLPSGIQKISGIFSRGEVLRIVDAHGKDVGHGVTRYSSEALLLIAGKQSAEIVSLLSYGHGSVVIHRDDMILAS